MRIDLDRRVRPQSQVALAQDDRVRGPKCFPSVVGCFVQVCRTSLRRKIWPKCVDDAVTVDPMPIGEREDLDEVGGSALCPGASRDGTVAEPHFEGPKCSDRDPDHAQSMLARPTIDKGARTTRTALRSQ